MIFLALNYDTIAKTVTVPDDKLNEVCAYSNYGYRKVERFIN